jgi:zinc transport system substrate-binding protein
VKRIAHQLARRIWPAMAFLSPAVALAAGVATAGPAEAAPRIVATIAPIHSLAAAVMEGVGEPRLLLPGNVSPHDYAMKPSDARAVAEADLVVWVGESLETFLTGILETSGAPTLELIEAPGIDPVPYTAGSDEPGHDDVSHDEAGQDDHAGEQDDHGHDHAGLDPHIWLDPVRAQAMAAAIAERLAEIDPDNAERYRANVERLSTRLAELDREIGQRLEPVRGKTFVTFHEGFDYFVRRYGLSQALSLTLNPQRRPGARTMSALRERIRTERIACAFTEPQYDERALRRLTDETGMQIGRLDSEGVGAGLTPGPDLYFDLMRANAAAVAGCLSGD